MQEARKYLNTLRKALKNWVEWTGNGNEWLASGDKQLLMGWIEFEARKLQKLDAGEVKVELLVDEEKIGWRLKCLDDDFKMLATIEYINDTMNTPAQLSDDEANEEINRYRQQIETKALDLIRVYKECERYTKPNDPILEKALKDPVLLRIFKWNRKNLEEFIQYCEGDTSITDKAIRAKELSELGKVRKDEMKTPLHKALKKIGLEVGSYPTWQQGINKY